MIRAGLLLLGLATLTGCTTSALLGGGVPSRRVVDDVAPGTFSAPAIAETPEHAADLQRAEGYGLVHAPELQRHLSQVLARLAAQSPVRGVPARVHVTANPGQYGAKSTPDGSIFLFLGTVQQAESEDEVAAVLAHELSHVVRGHAAVDLSKDVQAHGVLWSGVALAAHAWVAKERGTGSSGALRDQATAMTAQALLLQLTQRVLIPSWSRTQEREADLLGIDLVAAAGYDPHAFETMLDRMLAAEATAPPQETLAAQLGQTLGGTAGVYLRGGSTDAVTTTAVTGAAKVLIDRLSRDHPDTGERRTLVTAYLARHHPAPPPARAEASWTKVRTSGATKRILQGYTNAQKAEQALADGDHRAAEQLATQSTKRETAQHAYPTAVLASVQLGKHRHDGAVATLRRAISGPEPAWQSYRMLGHAQMMTQRPEDAVRTLEEGYRRLGEPQQAIPYLLLAYDRAGRSDDAKNLAARCAVQYPRLQLDGLCAPAKSLETATGETAERTAETSRAQPARGGTANDANAREGRERLKRAFGL